MFYIANNPSQPETQTTALNLQSDPIMIDVDFINYGVWAGVADLAWIAFNDLKQKNDTALLDRHDYALNMILSTKYNDVTLKYASLTDLASGQEKTRNFPLDRAYRIIHGMVEMLRDWRSKHHVSSELTVVVHNFANAQHLAKNFVLELIRRTNQTGLFTILIDAEPAQDDPEILDFNHLAFSPCDLQIPPEPENTLSPTPETIAALEANIHVYAENWEQQFLTLRKHYTETGKASGMEMAQICLRAACYYNHFGYYYESSTMLNAVLPFFNDIVQDNQLSRWDYIGNLFQGQVTTGNAPFALQLIEEYAVPYITEPELLAKMHYLISMIHLRYLPEQSIPLAEKHITLSAEHVEQAQGKIKQEDYYFLKVFISNGLAFLRVRQGRAEEAARMCNDGYQFLTEKLGEEQHQLHRSVLLYNAAQVYVMMGDAQTALKYYQQTIQLDPYYSEYYNETGNLYQQLEDFEQANRFYSQAIQFSAPYPEIHFNQGMNYLNLGESAPALQHFLASLDINPQQPDLYLLIAEIYEEQGERNKALQTYNQVLSLIPGNVTALSNRAILHFEDENYHDAYTDLKHAATLEPENEDIAFNLQQAQAKVPEVALVQ